MAVSLMKSMWTSTSSNYIDSERYHIFPISTLIWLCKISYGHWLSFFKKVIILSFQGVFQTLLGLLHAGLWSSISFGRGRPDGQLVADTLADPVLRQVTYKCGHIFLKVIILTNFKASVVFPYLTKASHMWAKATHLEYVYDCASYLLLLTLCNSLRTFTISLWLFTAMSWHWKQDTPQHRNSSL